MTDIYKERIRPGIPTQMTDKQKALLRAFADEMGDNTREHRQSFLTR